MSELSLAGMPSRGSPHVKARDRLGMTLFLSVAIHAVVVLGVGFQYAAQRVLEDDKNYLEITLATKPDQEEPKEADYLAQSHQHGGGTLDEKAMPTTTMQGPQRLQTAQQPVQVTQTIQPRTKSDAKKQVMQIENTRGVEAKQSKRKGETQKSQPTQPSLYARSIEFARLNAQLSAQREEYARRPRKKFISASTKEYKYAAYMEAWRMKVERFGNLNYPEEAARRNLFGSLRMAVEIKSDGSLAKVEIRRSSGSEILDNAAIKIVQMTAPFAQFPDNIKKDADHLVITRTWQFERGDRLSSM